MISFGFLITSKAAFNQGIDAVDRFFGATSDEHAVLVGRVEGSVGETDEGNYAFVQIFVHGLHDLHVIVRKTGFIKAEHYTNGTARKRRIDRDALRSWRRRGRSSGGGCGCGGRTVG